MNKQDHLFLLILYISGDLHRYIQRLIEKINRINFYSNINETILIGSLILVAEVISPDECFEAIVVNKIDRDEETQKDGIHKNDHLERLGALNTKIPGVDCWKGLLQTFCEGA